MDTHRACQSSFYSPTYISRSCLPLRLSFFLGRNEPKVGHPTIDVFGSCLAGWVDLRCMALRSPTCRLGGFLGTAKANQSLQDLLFTFTFCYSLLPYWFVIFSIFLSLTLLPQLFLFHLIFLAIFVIF
ncbi:uncharacterized protein BYT42DRAFT_260793 [Radiomyces spectabilis]|uniref:uncharacterized protein n=1 Tax=Radiomyces spectabilis TaxID=64574 RepID=UPI0022206A38|nr:uncharacterized protein BYT42DRAFT_260793 [Radiomyces spectabilis]KAI8384430.1 hypothetical protein BYT42DRAFT_260793 [Radiomyces spectabilis]